MHIDIMEETLRIPVQDINSDKGTAMKQVVYIDVLFVLNMFINYLLLLTTAKITHLEASRWRLLGGAALGGLYALLIFTPVINIIYTLGAKLLFSLSIVLTVFKNLNAKRLIKALACFYGVNFAFAGAMFAIWITLTPKGMMINNGIVYFNFSIVTLVITAVIIFFLLNLLSFFNRRQVAHSHQYQVTLSLNGKTAKAAALMDTGNTLTDAFSGTPVVVAEYRVVEKLFPENLHSFFQGKADEVYQMNREWSARIRLIPFSSIGGEGMLPAFRPDQMTIEGFQTSLQTHKVLIAVCNGKISSGEYGVLLNPDLLQEKEKVVAVK